GFFKPAVRNMKMARRIISIYHGKINRHLHLTFAFKSDFIQTAFLFPHASYLVIYGFCGFQPLVEEPVEINAAVTDNGLSEIFRIRMAEFPLVEIMLHTFIEQCAPQNIL